MNVPLPLLESVIVRYMVDHFLLQCWACLSLEIAFPSCAMMRLSDSRVSRNVEEIRTIETGCGFQEERRGILVTGSRAEGLALQDCWGQKPADIDSMVLYGGSWGVTMPQRQVCTTNTMPKLGLNLWWSMVALRVCSWPSINNILHRRHPECLTCWDILLIVCPECSVSISFDLCFRFLFQLCSGVYMRRARWLCCHDKCWL